MGHTIWLQVTDGTMTTGDEGDHSLPLLDQAVAHGHKFRLLIVP